MSIPDFEWPRCPEHGEEVVVGKSYRNDEPVGYFASCHSDPSCNRQARGKDALSALRAFAELVEKETS